MGKRAIFVDRDGTLVEEVDFLSKPEDLRIFPFTGEAIRLLKDAGYLVIVVSNQSGVGRRFFEDSAVYEIHEDMQSRLDGQLDGLYFCPHLPDAGCECRKPEIGMIKAAVEDFEIELTGSWIVGDKEIDMETGFRAGLFTAMVRTGYGEDHSVSIKKKPILIADNFLDAARQIVSMTNGEASENGQESLPKSSSSRTISSSPK
jgi:D-glycero-D-manno-heptose 1,7-bisphosphate phosphatase